MKTLLLSFLLLSVGILRADVIEMLDGNGTRVGIVQVAHYTMTTKTNGVTEIAIKPYNDTNITTYITWIGTGKIFTDFPTVKTISK